MWVPENMLALLAQWGGGEGDASVHMATCSPKREQRMQQLDAATKTATPTLMRLSLGTESQTRCHKGCCSGYPPSPSSPWTIEGATNVACCSRNDFSSASLDFRKNDFRISIFLCAIRCGSPPPSQLLLVVAIPMSHEFVAWRIPTKRNECLGWWMPLEDASGCLVCCTQMSRSESRWFSVAKSC